MGGGRQPWLHTPKTRRYGTHTHETNARKAEWWTPTRPPRAIELVGNDAARRDDHPFAIGPHPNLNEASRPGGRRQWRGTDDENENGRERTEREKGRKDGVDEGESRQDAGRKMLLE